MGADHNVLPPGPAHLEFAALMREARGEAHVAGLAGSLPICAVVVLDGELGSRGPSRPRERWSQPSHAESEALWAFAAHVLVPLASPGWGARGSPSCRRVR